MWLSKPHVPPILRQIAHGQVPLTHEGINTLSPWRSVIYVRDLMVAAGILPAVDRYLFLFERWLPSWLDEIPDPEHRKILHRFATWHVLRGLRATAATGPLGHYRDQIARRKLRTAADFLQHLARHGIALGECSQHALDGWFAHANDSDTNQLRPFLRWAINGRRMPRLQLPPHRQSVPSPIGPRERVELIRRIHHDTDMDLVERVAALLVLLYAQALSKVTQLTIDDITIENAQMFIRLGDPPAPVPPPFDALINQYLAARPNLTTATNPNSRWLFPGRRAGQPLHPTTIRLRFQTLGIPNLNSRSRALREMLLHAPPGRGRHARLRTRPSPRHRRRSRLHLEALCRGRPLSNASTTSQQHPQTLTVCLSVTEWTHGSLPRPPRPRAQLRAASNATRPPPIHAEAAVPPVPTRQPG